MWSSLAVLACLAISLSTEVGAKAPKAPPKGTPKGVQYQNTQANAKTYYDLESGDGASICPAVSVPGAGFQSSHSNWVETKCGGTYHELNSTRVVSICDIKYQIPKAEVQNWCGKEVKIWKKDNTELINPEGPFVLWDFCIEKGDGDCAMKPYPEIGLAAEYYVGLTGDVTCGNHAEDEFKVQVLPKQIFNWQKWNQPA